MKTFDYVEDGRAIDAGCGCCGWSMDLSEMSRPDLEALLAHIQGQAEEVKTALTNCERIVGDK